MKIAKADGPLNLPYWCWAAPLAAFSLALIKLADVAVSPWVLASIGLTIPAVAIVAL